VPQSTASRHLKLLHDTGWIERRSEGTQSLFRMDESALDPAARRIWDIVREQLGPAPQLQEDDRRLVEVLASRRSDSEAFFGRIVGEWDRLRDDLFGESFAAEALLGFLDPRWVVADLGCGTGATAELLAPVVAKVVAVDREPQMIEAARRRLSRFKNVEYRQDDLSSLSLDDASVDAAVISLVMVYMAEPQIPLAETARILRPGGTAMIIDLVPHDRESYRHTMGHQHLGFDETAVTRWASSCGLADPRYRPLRPATDAKGPGLFVATMKRPG
jgi:SAM-dependent methyltransferase